MEEKISNFVYKKAKLIIVIVVIINIFALISFYRFSFDTDVLNFFGKGNPKAEEFNRLSAKYNMGEEIVVLVESKDSLLSKNNLKNVISLQSDIGKINGISDIQSFIPLEIPNILTGSTTPINNEFIDKNYKSLKNFIENKYFLKNMFLSPDGKYGIIIPSIKKDIQTKDVIKSLKKIAQNEKHLSVSLAGNKIIDDTLWHVLLKIIFIIPPCAVILILLVFFAVLKERKFAVLALVPAGIAALWTFGTIFWSGQKLSLLTILSPIFVIVIGSAYGLHYISHFLENMPKYSDRRQLTVETMKMVGTPIFLATITSMAGFASLIWTNLVPIRQMGIFVSLGIGYAGFISLFFLPAILCRIKLPLNLPQVKKGHLNKLILAVSRQKIIVILIFLSIIAISAFYIPKLKVTSNQLMFFKKNSEIRQTFNKVEENFGSALPLIGEIVSEKGKGALLDYKFANKVLDTERKMEKINGVKNVFSIFDLIKGIYKMTTGQNDYPQNPMIIQIFLKKLNAESIRTWVSDDGLKIMIRTQKLSSEDMNKLQKFVTQHQDTIRVITGIPVLFEEINKLVVQSQAHSLGLALALIFIMLLVILKKFKAALVALIPIVITIIAILGTLAITKFNLNIVTANLSAIAIGVGVDYSVHLILGIYYFRKQGQDKGESVNSALSSISRPVLANAFGLAIGLSALFFSPLRVHFEVATVMWVAMIVSSMAALLLIPIFYSDKTF